MAVTDQIADMLTRIRNALSVKHETVEIPASKTKKAIADILVNEGYIESAEIVEDSVQNKILVKLKYGKKGDKVVNGLKRISKPGLRVYANCDKLPTVLNGMGIAIISTSKGIMTNKQAKAENVGGEVLAYIW